ncbi:hypothetical protein C8A00DRAFT_17081 [Chaetomidium leptoderma]|uniref:RING-type domain-containing protein n=1 Tax=Chaetomidium leptoderma TaxID=669021 RepID=A0AAN6ZV73_9PEZI|nr:hypothetical protein C8A00DRAFT_17081 [Chaetomidium leptoderma]
MADNDNFFDGTLDDFLDDQTLFDLAGFALPLNSPSPSRSLHVPPVRSTPFESLAISRSGFQRGLGNRPSLFDGRVGDASALPSDVLGTGLNPGPTRPGTANRPIPPASWLPELSRLNASRRILDNPQTPAIEPTSPTRRAAPHPTISATSNLSRSAFPSNFPLHSLLNPPASSNPHQPSRSDISSSERRPRDPPRISTQPRSPYRGHTATRDIAGFLRQPTVRRPTPGHLRAESRLGSPTMSANTRRSARAVDLTLSTPSQPGPSSRPTSSRITRRSASRALQPEQSSYTTKRKREQNSDDDFFGDDGFGGREVVDLVDKDEVPAEIVKSQDTRKYVKLSVFDCVICMDNAKDLTITHCGHLFCAECLHSALNMNQTRQICPICRQRIEKMPNSGKFGQKTKGFYPLELKLTTRKILGNRPPEPSSQVAV